MHIFSRDINIDDTYGYIMYTLYTLRIILQSIHSTYNIVYVSRSNTKPYSHTFKTQTRVIVKYFVQVQFNKIKIK